MHAAGVKRRPVIRLVSVSPGKTRAFGRRLGRVLRSGDAVALFGNLGSGKTTLAKGIAEGLGVRDAQRKVTSPTFALINEYAGRQKIYHMDWYRLERLGGVDRAMAEECLASSAVNLIEWADRGRRALPKERIEVNFSFCAPAPRGRMLTITGEGPAYRRLQDIFFKRDK